MESYFKSKWLPYLLLSPTLIILAFFLFYPAFETFLLSFYKVAPYGNKKIFAGLFNFQQLISDKDYIYSFTISLIFSVTVVLAGLTISLLIALLFILFVLVVGITILQFKTTGKKVYYQ